MKTKRDFQAAAAAEISNYPAAAELYRARDPRLLASLDAMAAMLAMAVAEQDVAAAEPFTKARDVTVLADAAAKGVLPFGIASEVLITVTNKGTSPFQMATGRKLLDTQGRVYSIMAGITVPATGTATVRAMQKVERRFDHTVTVTQPFYQVELPAPAEGLAFLDVRVIGAQDTEFTYKPEYVNVLAGDTSFHMLSDSSRRLMVEFGAEGLAGYAAQAGDVFTIIINDTEGAITLNAAAPFAFEYSAGPDEANITMALAEVVTLGRGVMDIPTMRTVTNYPPLYDFSAVYLGNFDFLVRRTLSPFRFLSVWNEQTEELVRGANVDNMNTLFVAARKDGTTDLALFEQIKAVILRADDSYRVRHVQVEEVEIPVTIRAKVHTVYDLEQVRQQIIEQVLLVYGRDSQSSKAGQARVLYKRIYSLLGATVPALQGEWADLEVEVTDTAAQIPPEQYRFVSAASLVVTVDQAL